MRRTYLLLFGGLVLAACGVNIDLYGLQFQAEGGEDVATEPDDDGVAADHLPCAYFYHCIIDRIETGGKPSDCLTDVDPGEAVLVGAVENCRKNACIKQEEIPGSPTFDPGAFMDCVVGSCWAEIGECAPGHGDKSCKDFAAEYKGYMDGDMECVEAAPELCVLEALYPVKSTQQAAIDLLLGCIYTEYAFGQPYENCVSKCNLSP